MITLHFSNLIGVMYLKAFQSDYNINVNLLNTKEELDYG